MSSYVMTIKGRPIGQGYPAYVVAEMSANHHQRYDQAVKILEAAKGAGADAVKLQTYTPDTMTIRCDREPFRIKGTLWNGTLLHDLYERAHTPWDWHPKLKAVAEQMDMDWFSSAFDASAVDFLELLDVPVHKVASFELVDLPLIEKMARTGKPLMLSTGMATLSEIEEAVRAARRAGAKDLALLKCTSAYPAPCEEMNLRTIPHMSEAFRVPVGLSDHTQGIAASVAAVALGACIVEKHLTLTRAVAGPDTAFSLEPDEFKAMVEAIRTVEQALGDVSYETGEQEAASRVFRRSLFAVEDIEAGDVFTEQNVRSIRPGHGLHPRHIKDVIGCRAARTIARGTPLEWGLIRNAVIRRSRGKGGDEGHHPRGGPEAGRTR